MANFNTSVTGFNEALKEITDLANNLPDQAKEFCNKLGEIARDGAEGLYGRWDVTVENIQRKRGVRNVVRATGNRPILSKDGEEVGTNILIAEFGAGTLADTHPWASQVPDVYPGSYSERYGTGEFAETRKWHWGGHEFTYVEPTYALYSGATVSENSADTVAKEVFK